jgi:hypothetical protein
VSLQFDESNVRLFHHLLTNFSLPPPPVSVASYTAEGGITTGSPLSTAEGGITTGSPLSPVIANFFIEKFEEVALNKVAYKLACYSCHVDDTFVIWSQIRKAE